MTYTEADLKAHLGIDLSAEQLAVVTAPLGAQLVVAGAGSGKTTVMAARVVWLVATGQVLAERVLGLTFTRKAAFELGDRARRALAGLPDGLRPGPACVPTVSTYDFYAGRLVAEHGLRVGVEPRAQVLADARRHLMAERVLRRHRRSMTALTTPFTEAVEDLVGLDSAMAEQVLSPQRVVDVERRRCAELDELLATFEGTKGLREFLKKAARSSRARAELAELVGILRAERARLAVTDFGDRTGAAVLLAEGSSDVGELERSRFDVVLLDEYQDTSVAQARLLAGLFAGHPVTAVGDPCQAIYAWRGASADNLTRFPEVFAGSGSVGSHILSTSRRSGAHILEVANRTSAPLLELGAQVVRLQAPPGREAGRVEVARHATWAQECDAVAARIKIEVDAGRPQRDCAVLLRRREDMTGIIAALEAHGLAVHVGGLAGLLFQPAVADLVALLEAVADPAANPAHLRLLTGPRCRLGLRDLSLLANRAEELLRTRTDEASSQEPMDSLLSAVGSVDPCDVPALGEAIARPGAALSAQARERLARLQGQLQLLRSHSGESLPDLVRRAVELLGLEVEAALSVGGRGHLGAFLDVVAEHRDLEGPGSLSSLLAYLRAAVEHDRGLEQPERAPADAVTVMTCHAAKGLEWPVVAVPGVVSNTFPETTRRSLWITNPDQLPPDLRDDGAQVPGLGTCDKVAFDYFEQETKAQLLREERRLAYVAFTRAGELLLASGHVWGPTQVKPRAISPFLADLKDVVTADASVGDVVVWEPDDTPRPDRRTAGIAWPVDHVDQARNSAAQRVRRAMTQVAPVLPDGDDPDGEEVELLLAELRRRRAPTRQVVLPSTLSTGQVAQLHAAPGALAAALARPLPRRPAPLARRGTAFHAWVEQRFGQRPLLDPDELPGAQDEGIDDDADLAALQEEFLASRWAELAPHGVEVPFDLPLGGRVIRGRIDAVYHHEGSGWEVVDWKTGRESADPIQLAVYRLAWARRVGVDPEEVTATFCYVATGREVRPALLDEQSLVELLAG